LPSEANSHARLEAFRDSRHCATYMVATQRVNLFGRDQESCDHVLGNPSVSRKHAAVIHDNAGGIYVRVCPEERQSSRRITNALVSCAVYCSLWTSCRATARSLGVRSCRRTTPSCCTVRNQCRVPRSLLKLRTLTATFLHPEGDIVKFGQSIRVYILKGASPDGNSAPVKKSWGRVKLRAPRIGSVLPKMPSRPHVSAPVTKIVNEVCYGTMSDEKLESFLSAALELSSEEKKVRN